MLHILKHRRNNVLALPTLYREYRALKKQLATDTEFKITKFFLIAGDKKEQGGIFSGHYFHQDLRAAQKIFAHHPEKHVDIGSRLDGFVAHVASFREIEMFDIRPIASSVKNIVCKQADIMDSTTVPAHYTDSISSLSVLEHFGLGRYGDTIDKDGHLQGLQTIWHMLKPGGKFYFSVPIGPQRIEFNAHRVFSLAYLVPLLQEQYTIDTFVYVDDAGELHSTVLLTDELIATNAGCNFGCGIFELTKK